MNTYRNREIIVRESQLAVLIVSYRRHENLSRLIETCLSNGIRKIYVAQDAPLNASAKQDVEKCKAIFSKYKAKFPEIFETKIADVNLGCAVSILSGCDWIFHFEDFAVILEDDCIPTNHFFGFINAARKEIVDNENIYMACGTQFAPSSVTGSNWHLSSYALIWGWATTRTKWKRMNASFFQNVRQCTYSNFESKAEFHYWRAGNRRAMQGFVDAWDTPLVFRLKLLGACVLLPGENLILNTGNDRASTHTHSNSIWLNRNPGEFKSPDSNPSYSISVDQWLAKNYFKISVRHLISTKFTFVLDLLM